MVLATSHHHPAPPVRTCSSTHLEDLVDLADLLADLGDARVPLVDQRLVVRHLAVQLPQLDPPLLLHLPSMRSIPLTLTSTRLPCAQQSCLRELPLCAPAAKHAPAVALACLCTVCILPPMNMQAL